MGKTANSQAVKAKRYVNQFPKEFTCNPRNELFCQLCATIVKCDKRFHVEQLTSSNCKTPKESGTRATTGIKLPVLFVAPKSKRFHKTGCNDILRS